jgi:hypothetical protein
MRVSLWYGPQSAPALEYPFSQLYPVTRFPPLRHKVETASKDVLPPSDPKMNGETGVVPPEESMEMTTSPLTGDGVTKPPLPCVTVTVAVADLVESAALLAVTWKVPAVDGAE